MRPGRIKFCMKKDLQSQFLALQSERDPHARGRNPALWHGKAREWDSFPDSSVHLHRWLRHSSPQGPVCFTGTWELWQHHLSLYTYRMLKDPSRADRFARLPPACPTRRITSSLAVLSKRIERQPHSSSASNLKAEFIPNPYRSFQCTHNWWEMSWETPS